MMEELAGQAHISFEGDLRGLRLLSTSGASQEETFALKRNTLQPKQDFVFLPLEPSMTILSSIGETIPGAIIHIQIEKNGLLQFAAYDNFHPQCIVFGTGVKPAVLESLVSQGIMEALHEATAPLLKAIPLVR
ncbi:MAG: hypothetical protein AUF67_06020 [Acidobacteria bacterium 13_1_20CM_58_21]|nr:MAG: hypothetical protein AUF67_06020 [Acidobacteria bacterium 13_1_20CM_58_21]